MTPSAAYRSKLILFALVAGVGGAALAQAGHFVVYNGAIVSQDVRVINGKLYVPLADMAKALNGSAVKTATGYEIRGSATATGTLPADTPTPASAKPVKTLAGKVGDALFDGKWSLKVLDEKVADTYTLQQDGGVDQSKIKDNATIHGKTIEAQFDYSLVLVHCLVKNGQKQAQAFGAGYGAHTALTDDKGMTYPPVGWDQDGSPLATKPLAPHAGADVTAIFLVPLGSKPQSVVFTLTNVSDQYPHDVQVSLSGGSAAGTDDPQ